MTYYHLNRDTEINTEVDTETDKETRRWAEWNKRISKKNYHAAKIK